MQCSYGGSRRAERCDESRNQSYAIHSWPEKALRDKAIWMPNPAMDRNDGNNAMRGRAGASEGFSWSDRDSCLVC